jgi:rhomboid family GlyGly-CTERM serine protease
MQILRRAAHWKIPLLIALVCGVAAVFGDEGREILRYERAAIAAGEYWRLVSGHFVHLGLQHLLLNLAGLLLVWLLVGRLYSSRDWTLVVLVCVLAIDAGLWLFDPTLHWYVGLSGMLHGLLLAGAIRNLRTLPGESAVICAAVAAKLAYEQIAGPMPGSESVAGGAVVISAHLYGAVGGALAGLIFWHRVRAPASI